MPAAPAAAVTDALRRVRARCSDVAHQRERRIRDAKSEPRREARHPQHPQRILGERRRHVAQDARREVRLAAVRIDQRSVGRTGHRVDRQVAPAEIFLERNVRRREKLETTVAPPMLALRASERILLLCVRVQEYREIPAHRSVSRRQHDLRRRAHDDIVAIAWRALQQFVAHRAAYAVNAHRPRQRPCHRPPCARNASKRLCCAAGAR